jgi:hypothetical protein
VVIEICIKYPGGPSRKRGTDMAGKGKGGGRMTLVPGRYWKAELYSNINIVL